MIHADRAARPNTLAALRIVAVSTDAEAPILSHADYAVIGDLNQVIPALISAIRARDGSS